MHSTRTGGRRVRTAIQQRKEAARQGLAVTAVSAQCAGYRWRGLELCVKARARVRASLMCPAVPRTLTTPSSKAPGPDDSQYRPCCTQAHTLERCLDLRARRKGE